MTDTSGDIATATTPASLVSPQTAIPRLPDHLVVAHILISEYFDDPADLARLPAVSRGMRDAVAATGLRFEELDEISAVYIGCLSALERRQRQGRLSRQEYLCEGAARSGHLEVLQWLRANGCPWDEWTCKYAAEGGHLEVLQWARANGCPWDEKHVRARGVERTPRGAAVVACERLPVGHGYVQRCGGGRASRGASVGARERMPVERKHVHVRGFGRSPRGAAVGARERLPVGREHVLVCGDGRAP